ncbi:MAG: alcohol dehydrogenase catalytic domain-containing protein [Gammaproteobacteria bacterium]|nr:alcohol dehydrogenase catalytic domain-containing protein [Gammaproteobacteria bacterium]MCH9743578.1 alcohol dehydrogenase catalytic domain-containing protein [Gammaproteobacteria bacterium]
MLGLWLEDKKIQLRDDIAKPEPQAGESLVKVLQAGICNTDLELMRGYYPYRGILGHEFVGVVEKGPGHLQGKRVVGEINTHCGRCASCERGYLTHCENRTVLGIKDRNGAFSEYIVLPDENLLVVPDSVSTTAATFAEPLAAALEIQQQIAIKASDKVLVLGAGKLGCLIAQTLLPIGCELVVGIRSDKKKVLLDTLGLQSISIEALKEAALYYDVVVECSGSPQAFELALEVVRARGIIIMKSTYADHLNINAAPIVVKELTLLGSRCGPFNRALEFLEKGLVNIEPLVDAVYPLGQSVKAIDHASKAGVMKVLIEMTS